MAVSLRQTNSGTYMSSSPKISNRIRCLSPWVGRTVHGCKHGSTPVNGRSKLTYQLLEQIQFCKVMQCFASPSSSPTLMHETLKLPVARSGRKLKNKQMYGLHGLNYGKVPNTKNVIS